MVFQTISSINSSLKQAREITTAILMFSHNATVIEKACKLSETLNDIQAHLVSVQSDCIELSQARQRLEKRLQDLNSADENFMKAAFR